MAELTLGTVLKTDFGAPIKVEKLLGEGGQGFVYLVDYAGEKKALKWYKPEAIRDSKAFYDNLKNNVRRGSPDKAFLWPEAITEYAEGSFGYIMALKPDGYYDLSEIIGSEKINFKSFKQITKAAIKITYAFKILHSIGYSYQDLNDGNFFINTETGDVCIGDNDNAAPNGTHTGIIGKPRYVAPEIVIGNGQVLPETWSDRYSLAVILFLLFFTSHPLEGALYLPPHCYCLTDTLARKLYGSEALFVFDKDNATNRPVKGIHINLQNRWPYMPDYMKNAFREAFSQNALKNPQRRLTEGDWLEYLTRFKNDICICSCGNNIFLKDYENAVCDSCGKKVAIDHILKLPQYEVPGIPGTLINRCQLGTCNPDVALEPVLSVAINEKKNPVILNKTKNIWPATTPSGKVNQVQPGGVIPFIPNISFEVFDKKIQIIK